MYGTMTSNHRGRFAKCFLLVFVITRAVAFPTGVSDDSDVAAIFQDAEKRDTGATPGDGLLLKSALFNPLLNPYGVYGLPPSKSLLYPPLSPTDLLLNRFAKAAESTTDAPKPDPLLIASYFKAKKDEFLSKLFDKLSTATEAPDVVARSVAPPSEEDVPPVKPTIDPSFFLNKKFDFLAKLFKAINSTTTAETPTDADSNSTETTTSTVKPTIVPADFWFPFPKPPKPTKAPKPPKPPKAKKLLKDALDTILLQSLLLDIGVDPTDATLMRRAVTAASTSKKIKAKKTKPEEELTEFRIPEKVDPALYSSKASDYLDKLFKALNKSEEAEGPYVKPKATVIPLNFWTPPNDSEYTSKLDAFLDLLAKSLNATETGQPPKPLTPKKIVKRSTFLDELLHRTPPATTTTEQPISECEGDCSDDLSSRSLIFKPFGAGYWIPQYLYAAKMGIYLDKLMDTINTAAADDFAANEASSLKRSVVGAAPDDELDPKDAAVNLIIMELTQLKNDIVAAFAEGIKVQKVAASTSKPFTPASKSFKKPMWGPKPSTTPDPVAQIQKRIDTLNDVFDKLTEVEKTLLFAESSDDSKISNNVTQSLESTKPDKVKTTIVPPDFWAPDPTAAASDPNYYISKTQEFLQNLYSKKFDTADETDE